VAAVKKLDLELHPVVQEDKPEWLVKNFEGKMPCLVDGDEKKVFIAYIRMCCKDLVNIFFFEIWFHFRPKVQPFVTIWTRSTRRRCWSHRRRKRERLLLPPPPNPSFPQWLHFWRLQSLISMERRHFWRLSKSLNNSGRTDRRRQSEHKKVGSI